MVGRDKNNGFTVIELIFVVGIISILMVLFIEMNFSSSRKKAEVSGMLLENLPLRNCLATFYQIYGRWPDTDKDAHIRFNCDLANYTEETSLKKKGDNVEYQQSGSFNFQFAIGHKQMVLPYTFINDESDSHFSLLWQCGGEPKEQSMAVASKYLPKVCQ